MLTDVIAFGERAPLLRARTERAIGRPLLDAIVRDEPAFLVREGAVPSLPLRPLPPSATGRPLIAHGNGHHCLYVERPLAFREALEQARSVEAACERLRGDARVVRVHALDAIHSSGLRAIVAVTTLHRGGAERIALDLASGLRHRGHDVLLAVVDRSTRSTFPAPPDTVFLHEAGDRRARIDALVALAREHAADVVHAHLLDGDEIERLASAGIPVAVTAHNSPPGWPARLVSGSRDVALAIGCSRDVTRALADAGLPARTIWNGIAPRSSNVRGASASLRLLAVANHRPQKRLDLLPKVVADLRARGVDARLVIAGEPVKNEAANVRAAIEEEAARLGVRDAIDIVGSVADVRALHREADVVVSTSAFEGLSLAHLEALAEGVPLVTTPVAGSEEIAAKHPHARVAPLEGFADAILGVRAASGELAPDFETTKMIERHEDLLVRAALPRPTRRDGLVLVTNNFATGGAQSSARRLLLALASAGVSVSAVVIEEQAAFPTAGREALARAGIPVIAAPRAGLHDPLITARAVAAHVDEAAPEAVLFWNVVPEHKVLLADLLFGTPVWDVSPGEMYFASFARYFARPRVGSPYLDLRDYGRLLAGAIVKYEGERTRAEDALGIAVDVVMNGVVVPSAIPHRPSRPCVVGTLARISPEKKLEQLVDAARYGRFTLRIAGAVERGCESYLDELRDRARGLPVEFAGERDASAFLSEIDLFVMISEPAGCPNASLEAMASGLAVVATEAGAARAQIVHGDTGLVLPRGDARALGDAVARLALDADARAAMGRAGFHRAAALFSVDRMAADYARLCLARDLRADVSSAA